MIIDNFVLLHLVQIGPCQKKYHSSIHNYQIITCLFPLFTLIIITIITIYNTSNNSSHSSESIDLLTHLYEYLFITRLIVNRNNNNNSMDIYSSSSSTSSSSSLTGLPGLPDLSTSFNEYEQSDKMMLLRREYEKAGKNMKTIDDDGIKQ